MSYKCVLMSVRVIVYMLFLL